MKAILTTALHCGPFRCRSISYIVWLFGLSGSVVFVVGWEFMTQVKTCLCVPFLFGFPQLHNFFGENKASAPFSFGKWPTFFVGTDFFSSWTTPTPYKSQNIFGSSRFCHCRPLFSYNGYPPLRGLRKTKCCSKIFILIAFQPFSFLIHLFTFWTVSDFWTENILCVCWPNWFCWLLSLLSSKTRKSRV